MVLSLIFLIVLQAFSEVPHFEVSLSVLPKPSFVKSWGAPRYSPDGEWILLMYKTKAEPKRSQIGRIKEDGSRFEPLCCKQRSLSRPVWLPEGKRILVQEKKGFQNVFYLFDLEERKLYPIEGVQTKGVLEQNRWLTVSPDGKKLCWTKVRQDGFKIVMGDLIRDAQGYRVEKIQLLYPEPIQNREDPLEFSRRFAWVENKGFSDGGKTLVFAGTRDQGGNLDAYTMDLETGAVRRITRHIEWDEGGSFSPDGRWYAFETTRAHRVLSVLSQIGIPPFLDFALVLPVTTVTLTGPWFAPHEAYLLDALGDRDGYLGQRLTQAGDQGWAIRGGVHWKPSGDRVIWGAYLGRDQRDSQIVMAQLKGIRPHKPLPVVATPTPLFAPLLAQVKPLPKKIKRSFQGKRGGRITLDFSGMLLKGNFKLRFENFSNDGEHLLNGTVQLQVQGPGVAHFTSSLLLTGVEQGRVEADLHFSGKKVKGFARSQGGEKVYEKSF